MGENFGGYAAKCPLNLVETRVASEQRNNYSQSPFTSYDIKGVIDSLEAGYAVVTYRTAVC